MFLLREDEDKPMKEYYEYDQGECEKTYAKCGPGAKQPCFMRHKEAVRISSLLPPARFTLVNSSPRAARSSTARPHVATRRALRALRALRARRARRARDRLGGSGGPCPLARAKRPSALSRTTRTPGSYDPLAICFCCGYCCL